MQITLHSGATHQTIGAYKSFVVPRTGELIRLAEAATAWFKVTSSCYPVRTTTDQESDLVELEIAPMRDTTTIRTKMGHFLLTFLLPRSSSLFRFLLDRLWLERGHLIGQRFG